MKMNRINRKFNMCKQITLMKIRGGESPLKLAKGYCFKINMAKSTYYNLLKEKEED